ncbi:TLC domain-containing protein At5g14285 isoform X1, partial [Fagus crenata]
MDLLHYIAFFLSDLLFIGHHLAMLFVFVTCRFLVHHGACAILALLVLAKSTSACQNAWTLAKARRDDVALAEKVYGLLSIPFYALYSIVRGLVGSYLVYEMCVYYMSGEANSVIPIWVWLSWIVVVVATIS